MADDVSRDVALLDRDLVAVRRDLHRHPELGYAEVRTSRRGVAAGSDTRGPAAACWPAP